MKRSLQEYVELVVFGLIALLVGTGLLWLLGWVLSLGGIVLKGLAGLLWMLLRFVVPVAIAGGLVYFLVKAAQDRQKAGPVPAGTGGTGAPSGGVIDVAPAAAPSVHQASASVGGAVASAGRAIGEAVDDAKATAAEAAGDVAAAVDSAVDAAAPVIEDAVADLADDAADLVSGEDDEDETTA